MRQESTTKDTTEGGAGVVLASDSATSRGWVKRRYGMGSNTPMSSSGGKEHPK